VKSKGDATVAGSPRRKSVVIPDAARRRSGIHLCSAPWIPGSAFRGPGM